MPGSWGASALINFCKGFNHWQRSYPVHLVLCSHPFYQSPLSQPFPAHEHLSTMGELLLGTPFNTALGDWTQRAGGGCTGGCLGEGICLLERKKVLWNDEARHDDTNDETEPSSLWSILPLLISRPDFY